MQIIDKDIVLTPEERFDGDVALGVVAIILALLIFRSQWIIDNPLIAGFLGLCVVGGVKLGYWLKDHPLFQPKVENGQG